jgi:hypothetical protein
MTPRPPKTPPTYQRATLNRLRRWGLRLLVFGALGLVPTGAAVLYLRQQKFDAVVAGTGKACGSNDDCTPPYECAPHFRGPGYPSYKQTCELGCESTGPNTCPEPLKCIKLSSGPKPAVGDGICADLSAAPEQEAKPGE